MAARGGKLLPLCLLISVFVAACTAGRSEQDVGLVIDDTRHASAPSKQPAAAVPTARASKLPQQLQQQVPGEDANLNVEVGVDYSDDSDASEEGQQEQAMTYSTYYPHQQQHHMRGKPCHQRHNHHQQQQAAQHHHGARAAHDAVAAAAAAADAADADTLVTAASHAWQKAQQIAARLAAADAEETAELVAELDAALDSVTAAEEAAAEEGDDLIDHRWDHFDGIAHPAKWSEVVADWINPARHYVSGMDDYSPFYSSSSSKGFDASDWAADDSDDNSYSDLNSSYLEYEEDEASAAAFPAAAAALEGLLPGDLAHPHPSEQQPRTRKAAAAAAARPLSDAEDFGLFILAEDNAANNMALFGVRSPAEMAAAAAAAAPIVHYDTSLSWSGLLEWLAAAPFETVDPQGAATGLLVACTLFVFLAFLVSVVDLRAAVHATAAAVAAGAGSSDHSSADGNDHASSHSSSTGSGVGAYVQMPAGPGPLRTRKSAFGGCGAVAAAATAAAAAAASAVMASSGCGIHGAGEPSLLECLSKPLLQQQQEDEEDEGAEDLEAPAELAPQPSLSLAPAVQRFYNPLHTQRSGAYQQLPDAAE